MRTAALAAWLLLASLLAVPSLGASHEPPEPVGSFAAVPVEPSRLGADLPVLVEPRTAVPSLPQDMGRPLVSVPSPRLIVTDRSSGGGTDHGGVAGRSIRGVASRMGPGFGRSYLAVPEGPGYRVRICAKRCLTMISTDAGPSKAMQRARRVCDLNDWAWHYITGLDLSRGLGYVTVEYL